METRNFKSQKAYMIAALGVAVAGVFLYAIVNIAALKAFGSQIWSIISPVVYGFCIAYLCNPIMKFFDERVFRKIKFLGLRRALSLLMTTLVVLAGIAAFLGILLPELYSSAKDLVLNLDTYLENIVSVGNTYIHKLIEFAGIDHEMLGIHELDKNIINTASIKAFFSNQIASVYDPADPFGSIQNFMDASTLGEDSPFLKTMFHKWFPSVGDILSTAYAFVLNAFFSILIAFHLLSSKETRLAQVKKFRRAIFTKEQNKFINSVLGTINRSFGSYIEGKLLDSFIIFLLCLLFFWIFGISEYFVLIAALIGITDIIPVIGPLIGAVPGGFIILITNPSKFILYVILVLLIQQLEGNIISPKILGDQMGVSALCVLISIVVMGSIFEGNPLALILSVPLFAVMVELVKMFIESRLSKKGLPLDVAEYYRGDATDDEIDMVTHYQNRKLTFIYEHSKLKTFIDKQKEKKQLRKLQKEQEKLAAASVCTDVTDEQTEQAPETEQTEQTESTISKE